MRTILGLGEVLWDIFGKEKRLGGAPANFAYHVNALGDKGVVLSRVGRDPSGDQIITELKAKGVDTRYIQRDGKHPTGTVKVKVGPDGQPNFTIAENVAYDYCQRTRCWSQLAAQADAICFGSLAQRSPDSRKTIGSILRAAKKALIVYDINLRQNYYSPCLIERSLLASHILKLNEEEVNVLQGMFPNGDRKLVDWARRLIQMFRLKLVCVTFGAKGAILVGPRGLARHRGFKVKVVDCVGSGDAFTAALVHHYLRKRPLIPTIEFANRIGANVAAQRGAMPAHPD